MQISYQKGAPARPNMMCPKAAIIILSGYVPLLFPLTSYAAEPTANLQVQAEVRSPFAADSIAALKAVRITPTATQGALEIGIDNDNTPHKVKGAHISDNPQAALIKLCGETSPYKIKVAFHETGLPLKNHQGEQGYTLSKIHIGRDDNGFTKSVTFQANATQTATVALQGQATAIHKIGGQISWHGKVPARGHYQGQLQIVLDRI